MINLALVLQIVSIGGTLLAERYTYVPYIGMAFFIGMMLDKYSATINRSLLWGIAGAVVLVFGIITFQRTKVWKDSDTLWTNVLEHFPEFLGTKNKSCKLPDTNFFLHLKTREGKMNYCKGHWRIVMKH
jgi:hypothetical protein